MIRLLIVEDHPIVRGAAAGEPVLSPSVAGRLMGQVRRPVKAGTAGPRR
ncbi:hypothetical protein AB0I81_25005 [Nonomuraea sp. NPDC050404]